MTEQLTYNTKSQVLVKVLGGCAGQSGSSFITQHRNQPRGSELNPLIQGALYLFVYVMAGGQSVFTLERWLSWQRIYLQCGRSGFDPWVGKIPWRRKRLPTLVHGVAKCRTRLRDFFIFTLDLIGNFH